MDIAHRPVCLYIHFFIHSFNNYLLSINIMSARHNPCSKDAHILVVKMCELNLQYSGESMIEDAPDLGKDI